MIFRAPPPWHIFPARRIFRLEGFLLSHSILSRFFGAIICRSKIRALGLSFRKKQDIIAMYLVKKESKGFLN